MAPSADYELLRRAHEELARSVAEERLAFADRVQEVLDQAQHLQRELELRDDRIRVLEEDAARLHARVEELHAELIAAHAQYDAVADSRSFRYTRPFRGLAHSLRRR